MASSAATRARSNGTRGASTGPLVLGLGGGEALAAEVARAAGARLGRTEEREFERGEHKARALTPVRGCDVAIVQPVHGDVVGTTVNDRLVRLWFFAASVRDAGAATVTLVVPYLPYARKDRRTKAQDPLGMRYVAQHFEACGADRIVVLEPHDVAAFENAFRIDAVALPAAPLYADALVGLPADGPRMVVSPDVGGARRAFQLAERIGMLTGAPPGVAFVEKQRSRDVLRPGRLVGDVAGADCVIVDDLVSSGRTLVHAARALHEAGARRCSIAVAHALFLPGAADVLAAAQCHRLYVTDSVPLDPEVRARLPVDVLGVAPYVAAVLRRLWRGGSLADLTGIGD